MVVDEESAKKSCNREGKFMTRTFAVAAAGVVLMLSSTAFAQQPGQFGNADEAKAMLVKAVAAVQIRQKRSICSTRERADSWTATFIRFASISVTANTLPLRRSNWSVRILGFLRTQPARPLA